MWILLVEDERNLAEVIQQGLEEFGHRVDHAADGVDGYERACAQEYDVLIVDWMLPRKDGYELVQELRRGGRTTPILMLTARAEAADQVTALDAGADDFLTKPFRFEVLLARLRALSRRAAGTGVAVLRAGAVSLDAKARTATVGPRPLELRAKELAVLELLIQNQGAVVTRAVLAEHVWGSIYITDDVLNTTVATLRRKLHETLEGAREDGVRLETMRGVGYRLAVEAA